MAVLGGDAPRHWRQNRLYIGIRSAVASHCGQSKVWKMAWLQTRCAAPSSCASAGWSGICPTTEDAACMGKSQTTPRRHPLTWAVQRVKDGCIQQALATQAAPQFAQDVCGQAGARAQMYSGRAWADTLAAQAEQSRETLGACSPLKPGQHRVQPAPAARGQRRQGTRRAGAHAGLSGRASERRRRSRRWAIAAVPCRPGAACALAT